MNKKKRPDSFNIVSCQYDTTTVLMIYFLWTTPILTAGKRMKKRLNEKELQTLSHLNVLYVLFLEESIKGEHRYLRNVLLRPPAISNPQFDTHLTTLDVTLDAKSNKT